MISEKIERVSDRLHLPDMVERRQGVAQQPRLRGPVRIVRALVLVFPVQGGDELLVALQHPLRGRGDAGEPRLTTELLHEPGLPQEQLRLPGGPEATCRVPDDAEPEPILRLHHVFEPARVGALDDVLRRPLVNVLDRLPLGGAKLRGVFEALFW